MDPKDQEDTGQFGDTTEAVSEQADEPTTDGKTEVNVDDNASEAAAVETVDTPETISSTDEGRIAGAADQNPNTGISSGVPPTPERETRS